MHLTRFSLPTLFAAVLLSQTLLAADGRTQLKHAISLYGAPKYAEDFQHFDYVNPRAPKGGDLRQGLIGHFDSLVPYIDRGTPAVGSYLMYDTLLTRSRDEPLSKYGLIAQSIELAPDNTWVAFYINPQARFHDDTPITAHDVKYSFDLLRAKGSTFYRHFYQDVDRVEVTSNNRVVFLFKHGDNRELPLILGQMPVLARHYWQTHDFAAPGMRIPVTSGPYRPVRIEPGRSITFARVEKYWARDLPVNRGRHNFNRIQFEYYRNSSVLFEALQKGEYDFKVVSDPRVWHNQLQDESLARHQLLRASLHNRNPQTMTITYNARRPMLADAKVRQALGYALDFHWLNRNLFHGMYFRANSVFAGTELGASGRPSEQELAQLSAWAAELPREALTQPWVPPGSEQGLTQRERKRKALMLLQESGWSVRQNQLVDRQGNPLELEVLLSSADHERIFVPMQKTLQTMGIKLKIRTVDIAQYVERLRSHDFDIILHTFLHTPSPGTEQASLWGSGTADLHGSKNLAGVKLRSVDALTQRIPRASSRQELLTLTRAMDRVLLWNHHVLPLWYRPDWLIVHKQHLQHPANPAPYALDLSTWWYQPE